MHVQKAPANEVILGIPGLTWSTINAISINEEFITICISPECRVLRAMPKPEPVVQPSGRMKHMVDKALSVADMEAMRNSFVLSLSSAALKVLSRHHIDGVITMSLINVRRYWCMYYY